MSEDLREMLTGNVAAAWGARLAEVDYVPSFPITPQTEIVETLFAWAREGNLSGRVVHMDSEHSMLAAAGTGSCTGARVFAATSSQGLLYGFEMLYNIAGWRAPLVLVNVSRALAAPITLEPDHNDVLSARDCGFLQIHCETCQEVLDSVLMAYRISEDPRVLLPSIVNLDGFYLSFSREPVIIPAVEKVRQFLPSYEPTHAFFKGGTPVSQGVAALGAYVYSYFRYQVHLAAQNALTVHQEAAAQFKDIFGREYGLVDEFMMDDADYVIVMSNSFATQGKSAVRHMREQGKKVGLLRLRVVRPFPVDAIRSALMGRKGVAVLDQNLAPGKGGI
ncbi:MAG: pyruvate synthase, partial [Nitrospirota bacterium]|nr:pyruvate synthase [Nitrospirota bacterium]